MSRVKGVGLAAWATEHAVAMKKLRTDLERDLLCPQPGGIIRVKSPDDVLRIRPPIPFVQRTPTKCPSCGSRSFIRRGQHHVCTYCRGEQ